MVQRLEDPHRAGGLRILLCMARSPKMPGALETQEGGDMSQSGRGGLDVTRAMELGA